MKAISNNHTADLPEIIKKLEELILASTGADAFEEILKLIYAKLYAEKYSPKNTSLQDLFDSAKKEWPGMFEDTDKIELTTNHLDQCMWELEKIKLYKTDLSIIDTAFEYLLPKKAKGSRGQYFTPRHVIAEIIKILNPTKDDFLLDPACGSGGFLNYAAMYTKSAQKICGIDYDNNMVKIAKARMLISGYQDAVIFKSNTLSQFKGLLQKKIDVICTNPPFGGEIKDNNILQEYELAYDSRGKKRSFAERHILFIEKIIKLLRPGGRAAIVVPQGILNNTNLSHIREWLYLKARIIGVIGLDTNTFKPHTNVKTSLLFLQRWKEKPLTDYPVFMAVSVKSGKNLSGKLVYKINRGKQLIDSDLPKITKRFKEFIKKENFNF